MRHANGMEVWCSGLTCSPVKAEIAGSNPVTSARSEPTARVDTPPIPIRNPPGRDRCFSGRRPASIAAKNGAKSGSRHHRRHPVVLHLHLANTSRASWLRCSGVAASHAAGRSRRNAAACASSAAGRPSPGNRRAARASSWSRSAVVRLPRQVAPLVELLIRSSRPSVPAAAARRRRAGRWPPRAGGPLRHRLLRQREVAR